MYGNDRAHADAQDQVVWIPAHVRGILNWSMPIPPADRSKDRHRRLDDHKEVRDEGELNRVDLSSEATAGNTAYWRFGVVVAET